MHPAPSPVSARAFLFVMAVAAVLPLVLASTGGA